MREHSGKKHRRTILITGATDGLGRRVAERLCSSDTLLLLHGRDAERGNALTRAIRTNGGHAFFYQADFASLAAVREMGEAIVAEHPHLDTIINNAGIGGGERRLSADRYELHFAVNHLAHFLLTELLSSSMGRRGFSRVINVASASQFLVDFDNVMLERDYDGYLAYSRRKLANIMHAFELADAFRGTAMTSTCLHPASMMDTGMVRAGGGRPMTSVDTGADAVLALIRAPAEAVSGRYFSGKREALAHEQAYDAAARRKLWQFSMDYVDTALSDPSSERAARLY